MNDDRILALRAALAELDFYIDQLDQAETTAAMWRAEVATRVAELAIYLRTAEQRRGHLDN